MYLNTTQLIHEFDRQVETLVYKNYPLKAKLSDEEFVRFIDPLKKMLETVSAPPKDLDAGKLPFVIVVTQLLSPETSMALVEKEGKHGVTILRPHTSQNFTTIASVDVPSSAVYLLIDIDRGRETINVPPIEALKSITKAHRSPLTIDEGIALITHFPDFLIKNNCFSLLASRTGSDKRVPAIWTNSKKEPNLGWCWEGNPHTWLGSTSCKERKGLDS